MTSAERTSDRLRANAPAMATEKGQLGLGARAGSWGRDPGRVARRRGSRAGRAKRCCGPLALALCQPEALHVVLVESEVVADLVADRDADLIDQLFRVRTDWPGTLARGAVRE